MVLDIKSVLSHVSSLSVSTFGHSQRPRRKASIPSSNDGHGEPASSNGGCTTPFMARTMALEDLSILKFLGKGASASVYLTRDEVTGKHFALKVIKKEGRSPAALYTIVQEQRIQSKVSGSDYFVSLEASWHDENNFYLAMPYHAGGDLSFELMRCKTFDSNRARFYTAELVVILEYLHKMNIIHRDVKPGNILFDDDGHLVLADFGLAKAFEHTTDFGQVDVSRTVQHKSIQCVTNDVCGTPFYMSPEMHYGEDYSIDVDYWALGIVLYRMLTGRMALGFNASDRNEMAAMIAEDDLQFLEEDKIDTITQDFLKKILAKDPRDRPTVEEIKAHPYFKGIDWRKMVERKVGPPWKPYLHSFPKIPRTDIGFAKGRVYDATSDPFPSYNSFRAGFFVSTQDMARNSKARRSVSSLRSTLGSRASQNDRVPAVGNHVFVISFSHKRRFLLKKT